MGFVPIGKIAFEILYYIYIILLYLHITGIQYEMINRKCEFFVQATLKGEDDPLHLTRSGEHLRLLDIVELIITVELAVILG
jgi:hypothetical protein